MQEINPYIISGVPEKHLEIGLHLAAPLQYATKHTDNRGGESTSWLVNNIASFLWGPI